MLPLLLIIAAVLAAAPGDDATTFTNPIAPGGADPWVIEREGVYHYCYSAGGAIWVASSPSLLGVFEAEGVEVWRPEPGKAWSSGLWAPELHWIDGAWWIYVAADDGDNANHRMQALKRGEADPKGPFERVGTLALPDDKWAIDGTAFEHEGQLYHVWSGWPGDENVEQNLYICRMRDPATPAGERAMLSTPEHDWEKAGSGGGFPTINEGPVALSHGGRTFILYAAAGSWSDFYCIGLLELVGDDPMDPAAWKKYDRPWFERTDRVFGPGHPSWTKSPDGREFWLVYHAAKRQGSGWDRDVSLQRFTFDANGLPQIDPPTKGEPIPVPSGDAAD